MHISAIGQFYHFMLTLAPSGLRVGAHVGRPVRGGAVALVVRGDGDALGRRLVGRRDHAVVGVGHGGDGDAAYLE